MYSSLHMFGISHQKGRWQETDHASITDCNNAGRTAVVVRFPPPLSSKRGGGRERETRFSVKAFENRSRSSILVIRSRRNYTFSRSRHPSTSLGHTNGQRPLSCPVVSPLQGEAVVLAFNSFSRAGSVGLCNRTHYDGGLDHVVAANMFLHVDANDICILSRCLPLSLLSLNNDGHSIHAPCGCYDGCCLRSKLTPHLTRRLISDLVEHMYNTQGTPVCGHAAETREQDSALLYRSCYLSVPRAETFCCRLHMKPFWQTCVVCTDA